MVLEQVFLRVRRISAVSIIPSALHTNFRLNTVIIRSKSVRRLETVRTAFFRMSGSIGQKCAVTLFCSFMIRLTTFFGLCPPSGAPTFLDSVHHLGLLRS